MLWDYDGGGNHRRSRHRNSPREFGIGMQDEVRGRRRVPQDIDFVVLRGPVRSDTRTMSCKRIVHMQMHGDGCRFVFEIFAGVNVVKGRL